MSDLQQRKQAVRARIGRRRGRLAASVEDVRKALRPLSVVTNLASSAWPIARTVASFLGTRRKGIGGKWSQWFRVGVGASMLVPLMRTLFPDPKDD